MIKYFVMGIKKLVSNGTCFDCGIKLIIPTWKWCELHDPHRLAKIDRVEAKIYKPKYTVIPFQEVLKNYKLASGINEYTLVNRRVILHDEKGVILGYK